jgi:hypothetical protein
MEARRAAVLVELAREDRGRRRALLREAPQDLLAERVGECPKRARVSDDTGMIHG